MNTTERTGYKLEGVLKQTGTAVSLASFDECGEAYYVMMKAVRGDEWVNGEDYAFQPAYYSSYTIVNTWRIMYML